MKNAEPWTSVEMDLADYESGINEFVMKYKDVANCDILGWKKRILFTKTDVRSYVSSKPKMWHVSKEVKSRSLFASSISPDLKEPDLSKIGDDLIERLAKLRFGHVKKNVKTRVEKLKSRELSSNQKSCRDDYMQIESKEKAVDVQDAKTDDDAGMKSRRRMLKASMVTVSTQTDVDEIAKMSTQVDSTSSQVVSKPCWCRSAKILDMQLFRKAVYCDQDQGKDTKVALNVATKYATLYKLYEELSFG